MLLKSVLVLLASVLYNAIGARSGPAKLRRHADEQRTKNDVATSEANGGFTDSSVLEMTNVVALAPSNSRRRTTADDWNHGSYAVSATRKSGEDGINIKIYLPDGTKRGDTLFLFLR